MIVHRGCNEIDLDYELSGRICPLSINLRLLLSITHFFARISEEVTLEVPYIAPKTLWMNHQGRLYF